ncbi:transcriptional regulator with XRE-family HTH domain [Pedobacter sp. AK017]|uniref:helix-turn-helix domain-containing protein n=1 Tax=Pedobacter sp. AK017 TaxID=2723073 RepID=UPI00161666A9|nr:helix-turn-helix transcriptional regulator [Pedobacter sp. AK017]MBB5436348.1 transcriptional regulator with XRE-family HTH domain [Pedobacter sp. AK017]
MMIMFDINISQKLRALRKNRGWTQSDMAAQLDISVPAYSKIECAQTELTLGRLKLLATILKVKVCWLLDEDEMVLHQENEELKEKLRLSNIEVMGLQKRLLACFEQR